ncbi:unnamed protein product [Protopolystoma xenopodis]|uniref:Protein kinase domain-containing protein n=1 Tax=Protopolystoma xenopodis TaxID=117903 RepID=A0A3S5AG89_9PLAT|nr:unnamed protein product [Protopolystoma xenopodis]
MLFNDGGHRSSRVRWPDAAAGQAGPQRDSLSPTSRTQLASVEAEVKTMLGLRHPNLLRMLGAVFCPRRRLVDLFVEWMPGGSIASMIGQYGAFSQSVTMAYGVQVLRGVAYLHEHGILHRDLKGANLLLDSTGAIIRISDFGTAARVYGEKTMTGQFQNEITGTCAFMAPEVVPVHLWLVQNMWS